MVDTPKLTPQSFSKRSAPGVPQLTGAIPNLTSAPSVSAFAAQSQIDMLINFADDAKRLEMVADRQFNFSAEQTKQAQAGVEEDQTIEAQAVLAESEFLIETQIEQARQGSSISDIPDNTMRAYDDVVSKTLAKSDLSAFQKKMLQQKYSENRIQVAGKAVEYQAELRRIEQANNIKKIIDAKAMDSFNHPEKYGELLSEAKATLSPKVFEKAKGMLAESTIRGLASTPDGAIELEALLNNGTFDDAISPIQKGQFLQLSKSRQKREQAKKSFEQLKALGEFRSSMKQDPFSVTDENIKEARETLGLTDGEITGLFKEREDTKTEITTGFDIITNGEVVSASNKEQVKAFNTTYETIQSELNNLTPEDRTQYNFDIIARNREVPTLLKERMDQAASSNDEQAVVEAVDLLNRVVSNPETTYLANKVMSSENRSRLDSIAERLRFGSDFSEAVERVDQKLSTIAKPSSEAVAKELTAIKKETPYREVVRENFTSWIDKIPFTSVLETEGLPAVALDRAEVFYRIAHDDKYAETRSSDEAKKAGIEALNSRFGRDDVNGQDQIIEFPPSRYVGIEGEDNFWIREQMLDFAREQTKDTLMDPKTLESFEDRIQLVPDIKETARGAQVNDPGYNVVMIGASGELIKLNDDNHLFHFDQQQRKDELIKMAQDKSLAKAEWDKRESDVVRRFGSSSLQLDRLRLAREKAGVGR